ncbi:MAG: DsbA family protein [bacterium]|nr:DsbA family protein [bacterium]
MTPRNQPSSLSIISAIVFIILLIALAIYSGNKSTSQTFEQGISIGPGNAKVTFAEFYDYECPACQILATQIMPTLKAEYKNKVRFVYKQFPLSQHDKAKPAAAAAFCANDQEKFTQLHDLLIENYDNWMQNVQLIDDYAKEAGLDMDKYHTCTSSKQTADLINRDYQEGISKGIKATPTVFINGEKVEGVRDLKFYRKKIDSLLTQ